MPYAVLQRAEIFTRLQGRCRRSPRLYLLRKYYPIPTARSILLTGVARGNPIFGRSVVFHSTPRRSPSSLFPPDCSADRGCEIANLRFLSFLERSRCAASSSSAGMGLKWEGEDRKRPERVLSLNRSPQLIQGHQLISVYSKKQAGHRRLDP